MNSMTLMNNFKLYRSSTNLTSIKLKTKLMRKIRNLGSALRNQMPTKITSKKANQNKRLCRRGPKRPKGKSKKTRNLLRILKLSTKIYDRNFTNLKPAK